MVEEWKDVPEFPYYEISNLGNLRRKTRILEICYPDGRTSYQNIKSMPLKPRFNHSGYREILLTNVSKKKINCRIARLVLLAFVGSPPRPEYHACHNDGIKTNDRLDNLRWDSPSNNNLDKELHGTHNKGERHNLAKITEKQALEIKDKLKNYRYGDISRIAEEYQIPYNIIANIKLNRTWKHL